MDQPSPQAFYSRSLHYRRFRTRDFTCCTRPIFTDCHGRNLKEKLSSIATCKGIRNPGNFCLRNPYPESGKILFVESGIPGFGIRNTARGIRNPTNDCNPESKFHWQRMGSRIHGVEYRIQNGVGFTYMGRPVTTLSNEETTRTISSKLESEKSRQSLCRPAILSKHQRKSLRLIVRVIWNYYVEVKPRRQKGQIERCF